MSTPPNTPPIEPEKQVTADAAAPTETEAPVELTPQQKDWLEWAKHDSRINPNLSIAPERAKVEYLNG